MKFALLTFTCLSLFLSAVLAHENHAHDHQHASAEAVELQLDAGKKWQTDAPLRAGMAGIKDTLASKLNEIHNAQLKNPQYAELADKITEHTNSIFKNCKLSPKADAQLHLVLAQILDGNNKMKTADSPKDRRMGAIKIVGALRAYAKYFDHPGWQELKH